MMNTELRFTGTKIGEVLHEQGRRQDWLAAKVGVTPATVNRWIRGSRSVDQISAQRISAALGVPFFLLFKEPIGYESSLEGSEKDAA